MPEVEGTNVGFDEAIGFFRNKVRLPTETWTDLWQGMHARGFVIAGAQRDALLEDFQGAIGKALDEGTTLAAFRDDFDRIVARHGWSYRGGRGWRSRVIFETNLRTAYQAGRWQQIQRLKDRMPFLRYVSVLDARTRRQHAAWHGTVLPADDPWWQTHYPSNGWGCRCIVQQLSQDDLERYGYRISDEAPPMRMETRTINTPDGPVSIQVPSGIDPGWSYNVGEAAFGRGADLIAQERHGPWDDLLAPGGNRLASPGRLAPVTPRARLGPRAAGEDNLRGALRSAIGGDEAIFTDPIGGRVSVGQALVDHMLADAKRLDGREIYFPLIPELIEDPAEIWAGFAASAVSGRVALRRRYVKLIDLGQKQTLGLVADLDGGNWSGFTFFRGAPTGERSGLRSGLRTFQKG